MFHPRGFHRSWVSYVSSGDSYSPVIYSIGGDGNLKMEFESFEVNGDGFRIEFRFSLIFSFCIFALNSNKLSINRTSVFYETIRFRHYDIRGLLFRA